MGQRSCIIQSSCRIQHPLSVIRPQIQIHTRLGRRTWHRDIMARTRIAGCRTPAEARGSRDSVLYFSTLVQSLNPARLREAALTRYSVSGSRFVSRKVAPEK